MAFLFTVCAALRLARFNVSPGRYKGRFEGMPSPAAAGMVASTQWFVSFLRESGVADRGARVPGRGRLVVLGLLMVSPIPYRSGKELDLRHSLRHARARRDRADAGGAGALGHALRDRRSPTALSGPVEWLWRRATGAPLEEIAPAPPLPGEPPRG